MDWNNFQVVIAEFDILIQAELAKSVLDANQIWCYLQGEYVTKDKGVKLLVKREDAEVAKEILQIK